MTQIHASALPPAPSSPSQAEPIAEEARLTKRESEVVRLISLGCTTIEIGRILDIAEATADNTRTRAMRKLRISKAALLTRVAIQTGITSPMDKLTSEEKLKAGIEDDGWN
jgi:DNA-binding CsgD family transcriptional regulator